MGRNGYFWSRSRVISEMRETDIVKKIGELFEYRGIHELAVRFGQIDSEYYDLLIELQYSIFLYDKYLEQHEFPESAHLAKLWVDIVKVMRTLGCSQEESVSLLSEIRTYARNELSMRHGILMSSLPISYFYYYKSCDVRLMRKLLLRKSDVKLSLLEDSTWYIFDWVTEVNDDVSDVIEDWDTYNGNRFLQSCHEIGYAPTSKEYLSFLKALRRKLDDTEVLSCDHMNLNRATNLEINRTLELISELQEVFTAVEIKPI